MTDRIYTAEEALALLVKPDLRLTGLERELIASVAAESARADALAGQVAELSRRLGRYGDHDVECRYSRGFDDCSCGYGDSAEEAVNEAQTHDDRVRAKERERILDWLRNGPDRGRGSCAWEATVGDMRRELADELESGP